MIRKGFIVENAEILRPARFKVFGEMADGLKCWHEVDEDGNEIEGAWYSCFCMKINGKRENFFVLEGVE